MSGDNSSSRSPLARVRARAWRLKRLPRVPLQARQQSTTSGSLATPSSWLTSGTTDCTWSAWKRQSVLRSSPRVQRSSQRSSALWDGPSLAHRGPRMPVGRRQVCCQHVTQTWSFTIFVFGSLAVEACARMTFEKYLLKPVKSHDCASHGGLELTNISILARFCNTF